MMYINAVNEKKIDFWKALRASFLVAGTTIGAGMLGIPAVTAPGGFLIACMSTLAVCVVLYMSGLYFAEATLHMPVNANLISVSERFLGRYGKWAAGGMFLFLYYALLLAYTSGIGTITTQFSWMSTNPNINSFIALAFMGAILYAGVYFVDRLNFIMSVGLFISFFFLIQMQVTEVSKELLVTANPSYFFLSIPVLFSAFGYHNIIPSICDHLDRDKRAIRMALIAGSCIALVIYVLWQLVILGSATTAQIADAQAAGKPIFSLINGTGSTIFLLANVFSIFAICTSVLGVGLSMIDFISDGWGVPKQGVGRMSLTLLTLIPPFLLSMSYPNIFEAALGYAGGFGEAFLNCLLPAASVYAARYRLGLNDKVMLGGGKGLLMALIAIGFGVMVLEGYIAFF